MLISGIDKHSAVHEVAKHIPAHPLHNADDLDGLMEQIGDAHIVLLGEASHGTAEYYDWRTDISKRLIQEKGFTIIGVEGEWADCYRVNQFIKGPKQSDKEVIELLKYYDRWPTWMWGNYQVASLVSWLNHYNQGKAKAEQVGFFGLDLYCIWESMDLLLPLVQNHTSLKKLVQRVHDCFLPFSADPMDYAYSVFNASASCRHQAEDLWQAVLHHSDNAVAKDEDQFLMQQCALVALQGEKYYRASASNFDNSWNIRDHHMNETIARLMKHHSPEAKMIIWEHNTHVGDARYTDMAGAGMVNVGQLVRESFGRETVYIVGFGSYTGTVIASPSWGGPVQTMLVPHARKGSWEDMLHQHSANDKILYATELRELEAMHHPVGHRAIGVQYNPAREYGNYVPSVIPDRYDAFIYIDKTKALSPIGTRAKNEPPDMYPSGY